jgi:ATP-dependent Clp protease ATP-binding subunit ClpC
MFERLSQRALRVLFFARDEASQFGSMSIDTEHLLLGLIREPKGLTSRLFADAGILLDDIRGEVLRRVPARSRTSTSADIPFSAAARRVLQQAAEEADRLLHIGVGTEHLLLGLLREHGSVAAAVLTSRGLRLDWVRADRRDPERWRAARAPWTTKHSRQLVGQFESLRGSNIPAAGLPPKEMM